MTMPGAYREGLCRSKDGTEIFYNVLGVGPHVILCDGIGCDQYAWTYLAPMLAQDYSVVRWNYRGHGRSGPPPNLDAMTLDRLGDDLDAVARVLHIDKMVLIGHSMGVQVILQAWQRRPQSVRALIAVCGAYGRPLDTFRSSDILFKMFPYVRRLLMSYPNLTQALWQLLVPTQLALGIAGKIEINMDLIRVGDFLPYLDHLGHMDAQVFLALLDDISKQSAEKFLPNIDVPTLVLAAQNDTFTPAWLSERMHRKIPNSEFLLVPLTSHTLPIELPDMVNLRVEKFLNERLGFSRRHRQVSP